MTWLTENPNVVCSELQDGAVLLNLESRRYYSLNRAGLEIWREIQSAANPDDLTRGLMRAFRVDEPRARAAATRFLGELEREKLIVVDGRPDGEEEAASATTTVRQLDASPAFAAESRRRRVGFGFEEPALFRHPEPLHDVTAGFDFQLPLAE